MRSLGACLLLCVTASLGCEAKTSSGAAEQVAQLVGADRTLAGRWSPDLRAPLALEVGGGATGADPWLFSVRGVEGATVRLVPQELAAGVTHEEGGRTIHGDVALATDAIHVRGAAGAELFYLLRDERAKTHFAWKVERGSALTEARDDGQGGLSFRDRRGLERLYVAAPYAIDARGTRRDARLFFHDDTLEIDLDIRALVHPIVLDPYVGTARWRKLQIAPSARYAASMAARGKELVVYGGHGTTVLGDTWRWDGTRWLELHPATSPPPREGGAMGTLGDKTILFGGVEETLTTRLDDTWSFDGTTWTKLSPTRKPPPRAYASLVRVGGKLVLLGGKKPTDTTWIFDGTDWTENTSTPSPSFPLDAHGGAFGDDGTLAFYANAGETWTFDGAAWTDRSATAGTPVGVGAVGRVGADFVLFSTTGLFDWSGTAWVPRPKDSSVKPTALRGAAQYAIASTGDAVALFGGASLAGPIEDLVLYDSTGFHVPENRAAPPARGFASLATLGDRAVLFGGWNGALLADTWEIDGKAWTEKTPATSPSPRYQASFADAGDVALLFGGNASGPLNDTWTWDHATWTRKTPALSPPPATDTKLARIGATDVLLSGLKSYTWSGSDWALQTAKAPSRIGTVLTGEDWSAFGSFGGKGLLVVPELGMQFTLDGATWSPVEAQGMELLGGAKSTNPLLLDGTVDLGRSALLLGHRIGTAETESYLWNGTAWSKLASEGLPPLARPVATKLGAEVVLFGGFEKGSDPSADTYLLHVAFSNGVECKTNEDCETGFCAQGVCCNSACTEATQSCNQPETRGTCAPILAVCTAPTTLQSADGSSKSCAPYLCVAGACLQKCASTEDCAGGFVCDTTSAQCIQPAAPESGGGCTTGARGSAAGWLFFASGLVLALRARRSR